MAEFVCLRNKPIKFFKRSSSRYLWSVRKPHFGKGILSRDNAWVRTIRDRPRSPTNIHRQFSCALAFDAVGRQKLRVYFVGCARCNGFEGQLAE